VTVIGFALLVGGLAAIESSDCAPTGMSCARGLLVDRSVTGVGIIHLLVGMPLMIAGDTPKASAAPTVHAALPAVAVGPGSATLKWAF
jgi:hypothetical protein